MPNPASDEREKRLRKLSETLSNTNRKDMTLTVERLSLEFYRNVRLAKVCISANEIAEAEGHRLIAKCIHDTKM
jgi:hypothetical protein